MSRPTAVVGLDLSLTRTGMAAARDGKLAEVADAKSSAIKDETAEETAHRIATLGDQIIEWVLGDDCELAVIEGPSMNSKFGKPHERGGLWWRVASGLNAAGVRLAVVPPKTRAKYGTGNGNADKDEVLTHVVQRYQDACHKRIGRNHDIADAIIMCAMGSRYLGLPLPEEEGIPEKNLEAMLTAKWPKGLAPATPWLEGA